MGVNITSSSTQVTISGAVTSTVPQLSSAQTVINKYNACNGGTQTVHTVTAGKTFYLMGASTYLNVAHVAAIYKTDGTTIVANVGVASYCGQTNGTSPIWTYAAGEFVKVNGTNTAQLNFWGYEA